MTFTITIAGRPNVGKSTLFNRLVGKQMAMVSDESGVTRDWREDEGKLYELRFRLIDTAGLEDARAKGSLAERTAKKTKFALEKTNVVLFVVDVRAGLTAEDKAVAREIRKMNRPIVLVGNKCEGAKLPDTYDEFAALGFGEPIPMSATHGEGLSDLYDAVVAHVPKEFKEEMIETVIDETEQKDLNVAVVGRPNAGKSTLINQLIGEDRMLTGPEPGLTRDSVPIP